MLRMIGIGAKGVLVLELRVANRIAGIGDSADVDDDTTEEDGYATRKRSRKKPNN